MKALPLAKLLAALFLIASAVSIPLPARAEPPSAPAQAAPDGSIGLSSAFESLDKSLEAGARWQRVNYFWNQIQPDNTSQWTDKVPLTVSEASSQKANGMTTVGLLGNPPFWATRNGSVPRNLNLPPNDPNNYWAQYVSRIVGEYRGVIDDWVIWNEPDIDPGKPGSTWAGTDEEYYQLLKTAFIAARQANPKSRIVFAGTTYWIDQGKDRKIFFERILRVAQNDPTAAANGFYFDVANVHLYGTPRNLYEIPTNFREILRRYGLDKPIWISETNVVPWDDPVAKLPPGGYRATMEEQASFIIQAVALAKAAGVERIQFYKAVDGQHFNGEAYGMIRNDGSTRPAYRALQTAATHLAGLSNGTFERRSGYDVVIFHQGNRRITVLWASAPRAMVAIPKTYGTQAQLITKYGAVQSLPIPLTPGQNQFNISLPAATANVADFDASHYFIGGDPFILIEDGYGERIQINANQVYYPIVGHYISNAFLRFYDSRGGLQVYGYPRSEEIMENGRPAQYFQRARLEFFADQAGKPYEVQLGLLSQELTAQQTFPKVAPFTSTEDRVFFPETGHSLGGLFLRYYKRYGGLDIFGYPVSEPVQANGRTVQYFQRMRMELFPEHAGTIYEVQMGLVGDEYLDAKTKKNP